MPQFRVQGAWRFHGGVANLECDPCHHREGRERREAEELALQEGMVSLKEAGMRKVRAGITSLEAAFEVTGGE